MDSMTSEASGGSTPRVVAVTGAAGNIGSYFAAHCDPARYALRLMVRAEDRPKRVEAIRPFGTVTVNDLADLDGLKRFFAGADTVIHLAGNGSPSATWSQVRETNIIGTYNVFAAAKAVGCRRVVYASSIHAVSGYPSDVQVKTDDAPNPGDLYGVSKCFGEALARYMAEQEGVPAIAIRIGAFQSIEDARDPDSVSMMDAFISHRDLQQLLERCIDAPDDLRFAIVHGLSENRFKRLDLTDTRERLGYVPEDDLTRENPRLRDLRLTEVLSGHNVRNPGERSGLREETAPL
jgi:uronate dehydrogenase